MFSFTSVLQGRKEICIDTCLIRYTHQQTQMFNEVQNDLDSALQFLQ